MTAQLPCTATDDCDSGKFSDRRSPKIHKPSGENSSVAGIGDTVLCNGSGNTNECKSLVT